MALSKMEKKQLDTIIKGIFSELSNNEQYEISFSDLRNRVIANGFCGYMYDPCKSISCSVNRINLPVLLERNVFYFNPNGIKLICNSGIHKVKNLLYFDCCPNLTYDFITKKFNIENFIDRIIGNKYYFDNTFFLNALKCEWIFNYTNDINTIIRIFQEFPLSYLEKMPAGLYQVIQENNSILTLDIFSDFYYKTIYGKYYQLAQRFEKDYLDTFLKYHTFEHLIKIIKNTLINGDFPSAYGVDKMLEKYATIKNNNIDFDLDTNRDITYNYQNMQNILDIEKNKLLSIQLKTLNFINNTEFDNYIVVVPQTQEDKLAEGRMQNNCVGYYYDDKILSGSDLIYFIRKKSDPDKSYITCRYNKINKATVEYRIKNNCSVNDEIALQFIKMLDNIITSTLN